jgi:hypothetical protein
MCYKTNIPGLLNKKLIMKKKTKYIILAGIVLLAGSFNACKKVQTGFLSDFVHYASNPLRVKPGVYQMSAGVLSDGSTPPFKISILDIRDKATGQTAKEFFTENDVDIWKSPYDTTKDTTLALIMAKRTVVKKLPLEVSPQSGSLIFNQSTSFVPSGNYELDLQVENVNGKKVYKNVCEIIMEQTPPDVEYINVPYFLAIDNVSEATVNFAHQNEWINPAIGQSTSALLKITRLANSPNQIVFKIKDKNGALIAPAEYKKRPSGSSFLNNYSSFSYKTTVTDTAVLYDYAQAPFPDPYFNGNPNAYYRIEAKNFASIDTADTRNWAPPGQTPYGTWSKFPVKTYVRFNTKINKPGKYLYELMLKVTRK